MQNAVAVRPTQDLEGTSLQRMLLTRDSNTAWQILDVGSVSYSPMTPSTTSG
jgi:hypothetical protein